MAKKIAPDGHSPRKQTASFTLPSGVLRALELIADETMGGNKSGVVAAALLELLDRLPPPLQRRAVALLAGDDPIANFRAQLTPRRGAKR